jgi:hypothetical protein
VSAVDVTANAEGSLADSGGQFRFRVCLRPDCYVHELTWTFRVRHTTGAVQIAQRGPNHLLKWRMVRPEIAEAVRIGLKDDLAAA